MSNQDLRSKGSTAIPCFLRIFSFSIAFCLCAALFWFRPAPSTMSTSGRPQSLAVIFAYFEKNMGQAAAGVDFIHRSSRLMLQLAASEAVLYLAPTSAETQPAALSIKLEGAQPAAPSLGGDMLASKSNYCIGNDPARWLTAVPHYRHVKYQTVYPGIDLIYHLKNDNIEFDFEIAAGADPRDIRFRFHGADQVRKNRDGSLVVATSGHELHFRQPQAWQERGADRQTVAAEYTLTADQGVQFALGSYDHRRPLTIDPEIIYATYLGGRDTDTGLAVAVDARGCAYVTGSTVSTDFPAINAHQGALFPGMFSNLSDVFITKINPQGTAIVYSTYLGGRWDDSGNAIAVDSRGRACITGRTSSNDDPATAAVYEGFPFKNGFQSAMTDPNKSDAFVAVLDSSGRLYYSSYLGGKQEDYGRGIAVDAADRLYVTGSEFSADFPVKNGFLPNKPGYYFDAFLTKIDPSRSGAASLLYSTHLGGLADTYGNQVAVDGNGCAYVTGKTNASGFPTTAGAMQRTYQGKGDIFVTKIDPAKSGAESMIYSTFLGNDASNEGLDIAVDAAGCAIVSGYGPVPTTPGAFTTNGSAFISKLNAAGNGFVWSARPLSANKFAMDAEGNVYTAASVLRIGAGAGVLALASTGSDTLFTIRFPIIPTDVAAGHDGHIYTTGTTSLTDFPVINPLQKTLAGKADAYVTKIKTADMMIVKLLADPQFYEEQPIRNIVFTLYHIDLANIVNPLTFIENKSTDDKGLLRLPVGRVYHPGMPLFIRATAATEPAMKSNRTAKTRFMHKILVDNLHLDQNGRVMAATLASEAADTTKMFLKHTSVGFSLIASIEWLASPAYIANLQSAFRRASNLLYDVTNGQAFIDSVAIFDNGDRWQTADIRFYAENTQWPSATANGIRAASGKQINLPPAFYSNMAGGVVQAQSLYDDDTINPSIPVTVASIVHEFGHYALNFRDEYENLLQERIFPNINFSFMDNQLDFNDPFSSEMADYRSTDQRFNDYRLTEHYQSRNRNGWDLFKSNYDNFQNDLIAVIHRPRDLGILPNAVMEGPNADWSRPDFSVGDMMGFDLHATTTTRPRLDFHFTREARPVQGARVSLTKHGTGRILNHGITTAAGHMKLFNAEAGDVVFASHQAHADWLFVEHIINAALAKSNTSAAAIEMKAVNGRYTLVPDIGFTANGAPIYRCLAEPSFSSSPAIRISDSTGLSQKQALTLTNGLYSAAMANSAFAEGYIYFSAPDRSGEEFFVIQPAIVIDRMTLGEISYFTNLPIELILNQGKTSASKIAILASDFPTPTKGLPDSMRRVSELIAMNYYPAGRVFKGQVQIRYDAGYQAATESGAIRVYRWQDGWTPLATGVNLDNNTAAVEFDGAGIYAVFLDLTRSKTVQVGYREDPATPDDWRLHPAYPNPFNAGTRLTFEIPRPARVSIEIVDLLGRRVRTLADRTYPAGSHRVDWDGCDDTGVSVPAGVYLCRLKSGSLVRMQKMTLLR